MDKQLDDIIAAYNDLVEGIHDQARKAKSRAYGGIIRAGKGKLVESISTQLVEIAWAELGGDPKRLRINPIPRIVRVPIERSYLSKLKNPEVKRYILSGIKNFYFPARTDIHVYINDAFVLGVECKAYTENAMLKRILVDFTLLKKVHPKLECFLFQLESQLGGDYSALGGTPMGSPSTHTLLSYFDVDLQIVTLLETERKVDRPIHDRRYFKKLKKLHLLNAIRALQTSLKRYV